MTDFSAYCVGHWRDGESPRIATETFIVHYDQRNHAYTIQHKDYDSFIEWIAAVWAGDNWPEQKDDQKTIDWLYENGVTVNDI